MQNPWEHLPSKPPYLLASDKRVVEEFNKTAREEHRLHVELLPEPFHGDPLKAKVVLLNLNPGFHQDDLKFHHGDSYFRSSSFRNLRHEAQNYPFHLLDPKNSGAPGYTWWSQRLSSLIDDCGRQAVAKNVSCIEYFPYHSKQYRAMRSLLPSQQYGFELVKRAIGQNAIIIVMRAVSNWLHVVPELAHCSYFLLRSNRSAHISPGNLQRGYAEIVRAICSN